MHRQPLSSSVGQTFNQMKLFKYNFLIFIILFISLDFSALAEECALKGKWQSNETATLREMAKASNLTAKQKAFFSNNFFGKLIIEYTCNEFTTYYEGESDTTGYKVVKRDGNFITLKDLDDVCGAPCLKIIELDGDCYLIPLPGLDFKEVFCKIK